MYTNCNQIFRLTVPAVRIAVARELSSRYGRDQSSIASSLGIAQAAVSKYLHESYSPEVRRLVGLISAKGLERRVVSAIVGRKGHEAVTAEIDSLASSGYVVREAMKMVH